MKKNNKRKESSAWLKALLGFILLSWEMLNKKEPMKKVEKPVKSKENKKILENEIEIINKEKQLEENKKQMEERAEKERKGWLKAQPEKLPSPTYWPFFLAFGLTFLFWGILTSWIILLIGLFLFIISLAGWINILRHEK